LTPVNRIVYEGEAWLKVLGDLLLQKKYSLEAIMAQIEKNFSVSSRKILNFVNQLFQDGLIDELLLVKHRKSNHPKSS